MKRVTDWIVGLLCIGILAAVAVPRFINRSGSHIAPVTSDLASIKTALDHFRIDCGRYPTTDEGLIALVIPPAPLTRKWGGPYFPESAPLDPWGNPYVYECNVAKGVDSYILKSYGSDGKPGGVGGAADIIDYSD